MPGEITCSTSYFVLVLLPEQATQSTVRIPACSIHRPRRAQYILLILLFLLLITAYYLLLRITTSPPTAAEDPTSMPASVLPMH